MLVGKVVDIVNVELRVSPAGLTAVGSVVGETDTAAQIAVAVGVGAVAELVYIVESVFGVIVVVGGIPNGGTADFNTIAVICTGDEQRVVQVARVRHGVLFIL